MFGLDGWITPVRGRYRAAVNRGGTVTDAVMTKEKRICPSCAVIVKRLTFRCPKCFHKFSDTEFATINVMTEEEKKRRRLMWKVTLGIFGVWFGAVILMKALGIDPEAPNRQAGFHCLSKWDGSSFAVVNYVKDHMRDPSSFEHIETKITPRRSDDTHIVLMSYRGRNGFGGMAVERSK